MDMTKYSSPTFLKVADVRDGPLQLQIAVINEGKYDKPDAVSGKCNNVFRIGI